MSYEFALLNTEKHRATLTPVRKDGVTPAAVDGPASATPDDSNHTVQQGNGDLELLLIPNDGYEGQFSGTFQVDADRGPGVRPITVQYVGTVSSEEASALNVAGANEPK